METKMVYQTKLKSKPVFSDRIALAVPPNMRHDLDKLSAITGKKISVLAREALAQFLTQKLGSVANE